MSPGQHGPEAHAERVTENAAVGNGREIVGMFTLGHLVRNEVTAEDWDEIRGWLAPLTGTHRVVLLGPLGVLVRVDGQRPLGEMLHATSRMSAYRA